MKNHYSITASVVAVAVAGCAQIAVVSEKRPAPLPPGSGADQVATQTIDRALVEEKKQPTVALGAFIAAARDALRQLDHNPADAEARRAYNFAADHLSKAGRSCGRVSDTALSNRREGLEIKNAANVLCEINFNESRLEFYNSLYL